jgi:hypothetical protein
MTAAETVSRNVRRLRWARGWTQEEAGQKFGAIYGEVWSNAMWSIGEQTGGQRQRAWTANQLVALAELFGVAVGDLLGDEPRVAPVDEFVANARNLVSGWLGAAGGHHQLSDAVAANPHLAGTHKGRARQLDDCATELRRVLDGETADDHGVGTTEVTTPGSAS